jgi:uncharacterized membrane protein YesL
MSRLYNIFSGTNNRSGKGISKGQAAKDKKMGCSYFFYLLRTRLGKISATNLIFTLCNFTLILFLMGITGMFDPETSAPSTPLYSQIYGMETAGESSTVLTTLQGILGINASVSIVSRTSEILMYTALLLFVTFGISTLGMCYNFRSITRGEPVYSWSDFFSAIKKNFKIGVTLAILDALMIVFIIYDLMAYYAGAAASGNLFSLSSYYIVLFFGLIYFVMRNYIYLITVTFDIKFKKMLKNALFLVFLGWKRSLACIFSSAGIIFVNYYIYRVMPHFGIVLPFVITIGVVGFIGVYCTYPVIDEYMIKPYYKDHPEELEEEQEEAIFSDRG